MAGSWNRFPATWQHRDVTCGCPDSGSDCDGRAIAASLHDAARFEAVFERHIRVVWGYAARRAGRDVADDVASQTFTVAFDRRERFRDGVCDARPWLLGIATNLLRRHRRSEVARLRALAAAPVERASGLDDAIARADAAAVAPAVAAALARLGRRDREVLALLAWGELGYEEIAEALGVPVGTVRSRIHRARARVLELLGPEMAIPHRKAAAQPAQAR